MINISDIKFSDVEINKKRKEVYKRFISESENIKSGVIKNISNGDLKLMFDLYDSIFFNECFKKNFKADLKFSLSTKMTSSAGKTIYQRNLKDISIEKAVFEIRMGVNFFFRYYDTDIDKAVNGITTKDAVEAFQLVLEHEICHLIELVSYRESNCKAERFKRIASNIFGHKDVYHKLPTNRIIANLKYGFKIGDTVSFDFQDKKLTGILYNINKRATIMVKDKNGEYVDSKGNRYLKYYVPLPKLS